MNIFSNQHGDVIFFKVNSIPEKAKKEECKGRVVVMDGEVTGHAHALPIDTCDLWIDEDGIKYVNVKEDSIVTHEEHKPQIIEAGIYQIGRVKEYDYDEMAARSVRD